jgi:4,5-dihydroxyphthalate decarboxylase
VSTRPGRSLSFALDMNDRTVALHLGMVQLPSGITVEYVPQTSQQRHERMLDSLEWDLCEFSLATYIAARANGWPLRALAVFPRRMFAMSMIYVHPESGICAPRDLVGRRVGIRSFHTTLCVWGLGDLASVYDVPLDQVRWVTERADPFPVDRPGTWQVEQIAKEDSLDAALERGDIDAILVPRVPAAATRSQAVPLFSTGRQAMQHYFVTTGVFPMMHTIVAREEVWGDHPGLPAELLASFEAAKRVGYSFYEDPNWSLLAEGVDVLREQSRWLGPDAYPYGLAPNMPAVQRLIGYERLLGLISDDVTPESLFLPE